MPVGSRSYQLPVKILCHQPRSGFKVNRLTVEIFRHQLSARNSQDRNPRLMPSDAVKTPSYQLPVKILCLSAICQDSQDYTLSAACQGFYFISCLSIGILLYNLSFKALRIRRYQQLLRLISSGGLHIRILYHQLYVRTLRIQGFQ
jgi:hypothetical protein